MTPHSKQHGSRSTYKPSFGQNKTLTASLAVSLTCIVVGLIFLVWAISPVIIAMTRSNPDPKAAQERLDSLVEESVALREFSVDNYEGRYAFNQRDVKPWPAPRRVVQRPAVVPKAAEPVKPVAPRGPSEAPASYGGPDLIALAGFEAWFDGGSKGPIRVRLNQENDRLRLIGFVSSKAARVAWQRNSDTKWGEYEVHVFERDSEGPWSKVSTGQKPTGLELIEVSGTDTPEQSPLMRPIDSTSQDADDSNTAQPNAGATFDSKAGQMAKEMLENSLSEATDAISIAAQETSKALQRALESQDSDEPEPKKKTGDSDGE